jgi:hypothetical protein
MVCVECGGMLVSALERTRGVCAPCYQFCQSRRNRKATGHPTTQPSRHSRPDETNREVPGEREWGRAVEWRR